MVEVRLARADDVPGLIRLARETDPEIIGEPDEWDHRLGDATGHHTGLTFAAEIDEELVGYLWADNTIDVDFGVPLKWLCLNALYVAPGARSAGVGAALVKAGIDRAVELGFELVHGTCRADVRAWWAEARFGHDAFEVGEVGGSWQTHLWIDDLQVTLDSAGNVPFWLYLSEVEAARFRTR